MTLNRIYVLDEEPKAVCATFERAIGQLFEYSRCHTSGQSILYSNCRGIVGRHDTLNTNITLDLMPPADHPDGYTIGVVRCEIGSRTWFTILQLLILCSAMLVHWWLSAVPGATWLVAIIDIILLFVCGHSCLLQMRQCSNFIGDVHAVDSVVGGVVECGLQSVCLTRNTALLAALIIPSCLAKNDSRGAILSLGAVGVIWCLERYLSVKSETVFERRSMGRLFVLLTPHLRSARGVVVFGASWLLSSMERVGGSLWGIMAILALVGLFLVLEWRSDWERIAIASMHRVEEACRDVESKAASLHLRGLSKRWSRGRFGLILALSVVWTWMLAICVVMFVRAFGSDVGDFGALGVGGLVGVVACIVYGLPALGLIGLHAHLLLLNVVEWCGGGLTGTATSDGLEIASAIRECGDRLPASPSPLVVVESEASSVAKARADIAGRVRITLSSSALDMLRTAVSVDFGACVRAIVAHEWYHALRHVATTRDLCVLSPICLVGRSGLLLTQPVALWELDADKFACGFKDEGRGLSLALEFLEGSSVGSNALCFDGLKSSAGRMEKEVVLGLGWRLYGELAVDPFVGYVHPTIDTRLRCVGSYVETPLNRDA